ncbi:MAG: hypothetical protein LBP22_06430 [Deltaproteobacteria bacterium]|jgi:hypothetical protein|nr:hypothetical protein [Deltaproteobacteria bacterium]
MDNLYSSERMAAAAAIELDQYLAAGDVPNTLVIFMSLYSGLASRDHTLAVSVKMDEDVLAGMALAGAGRITAGLVLRSVRTDDRSFFMPVKTGGRPIWR